MWQYELSITGLKLPALEKLEESRTQGAFRGIEQLQRPWAAGLLGEYPDPAGGKVDVLPPQLQCLTQPHASQRQH